ncbi:hypothetical protein BDW69DRAFT_164103 [Aspergillus filifer]
MNVVLTCHKILPIIVEPIIDRPKSSHRGIDFPIMEIRQPNQPPRTLNFGYHEGSNPHHMSVHHTGHCIIVFLLLPIREGG